ncbi:hypothetical protein B0O99DRAFT_627425 [Bisporella sp. PMI_857]|nr:hypothetical protein B0O99DRAFT_627425 [Bisporella sp. PMI_857]
MFISVLGHPQMAPALLDANYEGLQLTHPTPKECTAIWNLTSQAWKGPLTQEDFVLNCAQLLTAPLHRDGGMSMWILTNKHMEPDHRPILASCETIRKQALVSDANGKVEEKVVHAVASVYTDPEHRGRGYASRMMRGLSRGLQEFQSDFGKTIASVLWSDIGKEFYSNVGWLPFPSSHLQFKALKSDQTPPGVMYLKAEDLEELCRIQESLVRKLVSTKASHKTRMTLLPNHNSVTWFHQKEDFLASTVYNKPALRKGAIIGSPGNRIWVIWTRLCSDPLDAPDAENTLYILKLVIENDAEERRELQVEQLKAILEAARNEAAEWRLPVVKMWNPTLAIEDLVARTGIEHENVEREKSSISSVLWYGEGEGTADSVEWIGNEKFGWC